MTTPQLPAAPRPRSPASNPHAGADGGADASILRLYQAAASEVVMWRRRLDVTASWAFPMIVAVTTFSLGNRDIPALLVLVLGWLMIAAAVTIEARRYQTMHHSLRRKRRIETGFFAPGLERRDEDDATWRIELAADLRQPGHTIGLWRAALHRLRTVYLALVYLVFVGWVAKVIVHRPPAGAPRLAQLIAGLAAALLLGGITTATLRDAWRRDPAHDPSS